MNMERRSIFQERVEPSPLSSSLYYGGQEDMYVCSSSDPTSQSYSKVSIIFHLAIIKKSKTLPFDEFLSSVCFSSRNSMEKMILIICIVLLEEIGGKVSCEL